MPRRLLEEPHGQRNSTEEAAQNERARQQREAEEARKRNESWAKMVETAVGK